MNQLIEPGATVIFRSTASTLGHPGYPERSGQTVTIVRQLSDTEVDEDEVGRMYRIRFADGVHADAFADELERNEP
jgi:hypothetical protein